MRGQTDALICLAALSPRDPSAPACGFSPYPEGQGAWAPGISWPAPSAHGEAVLWNQGTCSVENGLGPPQILTCRSQQHPSPWPGTQQGVPWVAWECCDWYVELPVGLAALSGARAGRLCQVWGLVLDRTSPQCPQLYQGCLRLSWCFPCPATQWEAWPGVARQLLPFTGPLA